MGIDNRYLIFKNIQPGLTDNDVDSVLLKLRSKGITFNLVKSAWAVNISDNSLDLISQSGTVVEIIIDKTIDLSDAEFEALSYLKIKNRLGKALYVGLKTSTTTTKTFTSDNINTIGYYEFGFGMKKTDCYKFNSKNVLNNKIFPYDFVDHIDDSNLSTSEDMSQDFTLSDGVVISKNYLDKNIKYQTIPRYNIGTDINKQSMKLSVLKENVLKNDNNNGNYVFTKSIHYGDFGDSANAKYWASYPEIYPAIIFNTTRSWDYERYLIQIENNTNKVKIVNERTNDTKYYDFNPITDKLILYIRKPGKWEAKNKFNSAEDSKAWKINSMVDKIQLLKDTNTATLSFTDIEMYDISDISKNTNYYLYSTLGNKENKVNTTDIKCNTYKKIIHTPSTVTMEFPSLNKAAWKSRRSFSFAIGEYDKKWSLIKNPDFKINPSIIGYQLVSYENKDNIGVGIIEENDISDININSNDYNTMMVESQFYKYIRSNVGFFPSQLPYYGGCDYYHKTYNDSSYCSLKINGMDYNFTNVVQESGASFNGVLKLKIGYFNTNEQDAVALVVWHNIKQEGE